MRRGTRASGGTLHGTADPRSHHLLLAAALLVSCASDKGPAETALKAAEEALGAARAEAARYVPDQLKAVESALAGAKDKFAKGD